MSIQISVMQRNRQFFVEAHRYSESLNQPEKLYMRLQFGRHEITLHLNSVDDARRLGEDILLAAQKLALEADLAERRVMEEERAEHLQALLKEPPPIKLHPNDPNQ